MNEEKQKDGTEPTRQMACSDNPGEWPEYPPPNYPPGENPADCTNGLGGNTVC